MAEALLAADEREPFDLRPAEVDPDANGRRAPVPDRSASRAVRRRRIRGGSRVGMRHQVVDDEMLHDEVPVLDASHVVGVDDETLLRLRAQLAPAKPERPIVRQPIEFA